MTTERKQILGDFLAKQPLATKSQILAHLYEAIPDISGGGIRAWLSRQYDKGSAPWERKKTCPQCGKVANGTEEIQADFGLRYNGTQPQSRCKTCR